MIHYKEATDTEVLVIQISRHCSEQIIVRQREVKEESKVKERSEGVFFFKMKSSDDGRDVFLGVA